MATKMHYQVGEKDRRPWGTWEVIAAAPQYIVKRIEVDPKQRLSLQYHHHRSEHWIIVNGTGEVSLNDQTIPVTSGQHIHIPVGSKHRIHNCGSEPLQLIEIQYGDELREDDIIRISDDYARS